MSRLFSVISLLLLTFLFMSMTVFGNNISKAYYESNDYLIFWINTAKVAVFFTIFVFIHGFVLFCLLTINKKIQNKKINKMNKDEKIKYLTELQKGKDYIYETKNKNWFLLFYFLSGGIPKYKYAKQIIENDLSRNI